MLQQGNEEDGSHVPPPFGGTWQEEDAGTTLITTEAEAEPEDVLAPFFFFPFLLLAAPGAGVPVAPTFISGIPLGTESVPSPVVPLDAFLLAFPPIVSSVLLLEPPFSTRFPRFESGQPARVNEKVNSRVTRVSKEEFLRAIIERIWCLFTMEVV